MSTFTCKYCLQYSFDDFEAMVHHIARKHFLKQKSKFLKCPFCDFQGKNVFLHCHENHSRSCFYCFDESTHSLTSIANIQEDLDAIAEKVWKHHKCLEIFVTAFVTKEEKQKMKNFIKLRYNVIM